MALQQLFCCFCLQTVSNFFVAVVWYLCREADWLLDHGRNAVGSVWLSDTAPIFMCSSGTRRSSHSAAQCKRISVLCRVMVNPRDLRCYEFVPLNVFYLNTRGEKSFFVTWSKEHCASHTGLCKSLFSSNAASARFPLSDLAVTFLTGICSTPLQQPQDMLCWVRTLFSTSLLSK